MFIQPRCGRKPCVWSSNTGPTIPDEYEAIRTIAERMSLRTETVRVWVRKPEAAADGTPSAAMSETEAELRALRRKNTELEKTIEILKAATSFFVRECDPPRK